MLIGIVRKFPEESFAHFELILEESC